MPRARFPVGHIVAVTFPSHHYRLAKCKCGWQWTGQRQAQGAAIEAHWRAVESAPGAAFTDGRGNAIGPA